MSNDAMSRLLLPPIQHREETPLCNRWLEQGDGLSKARVAVAHLACHSCSLAMADRWPVDVRNVVAG